MFTPSPPDWYHYGQLELEHLARHVLQQQSGSLEQVRSTATVYPLEVIGFRGLYGLTFTHSLGRRPYFSFLYASPSKPFLNFMLEVIHELEFSFEERSLFTRISNTSSLLIPWILS